MRPECPPAPGGFGPLGASPTRPCCSSALLTPSRPAPELDRLRKLQVYLERGRHPGPGHGLSLPVPRVCKTSRGAGRLAHFLREALTFRRRGSAWPRGCCVWEATRPGGSRAGHLAPLQPRPGCATASRLQLPTDLRRRGPPGEGSRGPPGAASGAWRPKAKGLHPSCSTPSVLSSPHLLEESGGQTGRGHCSPETPEQPLGGTSAFSGDKDQAFQFRRKIEGKGNFGDGSFPASGHRPSSLVTEGPSCPQHSPHIPCLVSLRSWTPSQELGTAGSDLPACLSRDQTWALKGPGATQGYTRLTPSSVQVTLAGRLNCFPQEISWSPNPQQLSQGPDPQEISRDPDLSTWEWTLFGNCSLQMSHWGPWSLGCCPYARGDLATQTHRGGRVRTRQGLEGAGRGRKSPEASSILDCGLQSVGG